MTTLNEEMGKNLWPNGRCDICGNGLNDDGGCVNTDCSACVLQHEMSEVLRAVLAILPDAELGEDNDGQLVIYSGCSWTGSEQIVGNFEPGLVNLASSLASCIKDGEADDDGDAFFLENDDAFETLEGFISEARGVLGVPDRDRPEDEA